MWTQPKPKLTPEQYLEIERAAEYKSEYYNDEMFAMAGASYVHTRLVSRLTGILNSQLEGGPCEAVSSDARLCVNATGFNTYPDVVVICGEPQFRDANVDTPINPTFLAEVLSPSNEGYDRGRKFEHYRQIQSLREYMLVAQDRAYVELWRNEESGRWTLATTGLGDAVIELQSIGCNVAMARLYNKISFATGGGSDVNAT